MLGKRAASLQLRLKTLSLCLSVLVGCRLSKSNNSCNQQTNGLKSTGWNGQDLPDKQLSLIFLKGPSENSAEIGNILQLNNIYATFFAQGSEVEGHTEQLTALRDEGHLIGNSGYSTSNLTQAPYPVLELRTTDALITPFITGNLFLFYAPYKIFDEQTAALLRTNGLGKYVGPIVDDTEPSLTFQYDDQCWAQNISSGVCAQQYFDEITRIGRGIVAFHDTQTQTLDLLSQLIPQLNAFGFSFVRLDQIPGIRTALIRTGGQLDLKGGAASCDDYN